MVILVCVKDFYMEEGDLAFSKGKEYEFKEYEFKEFKDYWCTWTTIDDLGDEHLMQIMHILGHFEVKDGEDYSSFR